jgi:hypothetical protein
MKVMYDVTNANIINDQKIKVNKMGIIIDIYLTYIYMLLRCMSETVLNKEFDQIPSFHTHTYPHTHTQTTDTNAIIDHATGCPLRGERERQRDVTNKATSLIFDRKLFIQKQKKARKKKSRI